MEMVLQELEVNNIDFLGKGSFGLDTAFATMGYPPTLS